MNLPLRTALRTENESDLAKAFNFAVKAQFIVWTVTGALDLVLADEPTGDLDTQTARDVMLLFQQIVVEEQVTLLLSSHDPLVDLFADQVMHLSDGKQVPEGE